MSRIVALLAIATLAFSARAGGSEMDDEAILRNIESSLAGTHALAEQSVEVSFANGQAKLSGTVDTLYQKWRAEEVAARVRGVVSLDDDISVKRGTQSDALIVAAVRRRFEDIPKLASAKLRVQALNGTVIIAGDLSDARLRFNARDAVAQIPGVLEVFDRIGSPEAADDRLKKGVESLIGASSLERIAGEIKVDVLGGVVHFEGWVPRLWERAEAERRALGVNGVKEVINDLEIRPRKRPDADWR